MEINKKNLQSKYLFIAVCISVFTLSSCTPEDGIEEPTVIDQELVDLLNSTSETGSLDYFKIPQSDDFEDIPADPKNPLTATKVELGKMFFHETELGSLPKLQEGLGTYSCASCHHAAAGFQAGVKQGIGEGGSGFGSMGESRTANPNYEDNDLDIQPIRTPTALNTAFQDVMLWNGQFGATGTNAGTEAQWTANTPIAVNELGFQGLETQAIAGFNVHRQGVNDEFFTSYPTYKAMLDEAYPDLPENERYSNIGIGLAIAAFERTLLSNEAPFQKYLNGNRAELTIPQKRGALVFFGKGNCVSCHTGPALNNMEFFALGMKDLDARNTDLSIPGALGASKGRGGFTKNASDDFKFKTPQLYNLQDHNFFGHGGTFESIEDIIRYKNAAAVEKTAIAGHQNLADEFVPLNLNDSEISDLVDFLSNALYDRNLTRFVPGSVLSGGCIPNNDAQTKADLGCD